MAADEALWPDALHQITQIAQNATFMGWFLSLAHSTVLPSQHRIGGLQLKEIIMRSGFFKFSCSVAIAALSSAIWAQSAPDAAQCILAGRVDADQRWAPQARGVELLDAAGKRVSGASKEALASVKSVRLAQPALLSSCNGDQALPEGGAGGPKKGPSPAISKGAELVNVQAVAYPPLRVGGSLVELKLEVPAKRVVMLTR